MNSTRPLPYLLVIYFILGLLYAAATPPFEASDEVFHYPFVRYVAQGHGLPIQRIDVKQPWEQVGFHPPVYYYIGAALTFWIDTSDFDSLRAANPFARIGIPGTPQNVNYTRAAARAVVEPLVFSGSALAIYILRFASLLMGAGTITLVYYLAIALASRVNASGSETERVTNLAALAAALVAFNPQFIFISASVNNDNLTWLVAAAALLVAVQLVRGTTPVLGREIGERRRDVWAIGILLSLGALSKVSDLALIPIVGLALLIQAFRTGQWRRFFINGFIIVGVVLAIAGWWYVRNLVLYDDLLAVEIHSHFTATRLEPYTLATFFAEWPSFWLSVWGLFGSFNIFAPAWVYYLFTTLVIVALAGGLLSFIRSRSAHLGLERWQWAAHGLLLFMILATAIALLRWNLLSYSAQGRLMFTALAPFAFYFAAGLLAWVPVRFQRIGIGALGVALVIVAAITAFDLRAHYQPPAPITEAQLPANLKPAHALLAPNVELVGYSLDEGLHQPGDTVTVTLYWRGLEPIKDDYNLFLHLLGRDHKLVGNVDTWPGGGLRPTSFWTPGEIYPDSYQIHTDEDATTPTTLALDIAMWRDDPAQPFPITTFTGDPMPSMLVAAGALDLSQPISIQPAHPTADTLEYGIQLLGYDLSSEPVAGQPTDLTLYWQATDLIPASYTVFVHVVNEAGTAIAQADGPPVYGYWPTSDWQPNYPVIDVHGFTFPAAGTYRLLVGLYDPATVVPLAAFRADGSEWPDRAIELAVVTVQ
jgi:hypothetical protein